jgi:hypothetical protein
VSATEKGRSQNAADLPIVIDHENGRGIHQFFFTGVTSEVTSEESPRSGLRQNCKQCAIKKTSWNRNEFVKT